MQSTYFTVFGLDMPILFVIRGLRWSGFMMLRRRLVVVTLGRDRVRRGISRMSRRGNNRMSRRRGVNPNHKPLYLVIALF
jgi:hypothetical protein